MKLGILDFGTIIKSKSPSEVINDTIECAKLADEKGFSRYWLTEHHSENAAWAGPEIMVGQIARATERIRVGSAGILLHLYSPFKVAENFKFLEAVSPGRIDLGIGRGIAGEVKFHALTEGKAKEDFSNESYTEKAKLLLGHLGKGFPPSHPYSGIKANPIDADSPGVWVLGTGDFSVKLAAKYGTAFGYLVVSRNRATARDVIKNYKDNFKPSEFFSEPVFNITVVGACAESDSKAEEIAKRFPNPVLDVSISGNPETFKEKLLELKEFYGCDEIILVDAALEHEDRVRTIELLSEVMGE